MEAEANPEAESPAARRRPSRGWYLLAAAILLVTGAVFVGTVLSARKSSWSAIDAMPRFVGPNGDAGFEVELPRAGEYLVYYENCGTLDGRAFDTPRLQVWTTPTLPSMSCTVTAGGADSVGGEAVDVQLLGQTGDKPAEFDADRVTGHIYERQVNGNAEVQGLGVWRFAVDAPGKYTIRTVYREAVYLDPASVEVPPELTRDRQAQMPFAEAEQYEQDRAEAIARLALASLEPEDVLFAVGPDPTAGSYFNVAGLKGAATLLAFGLTAATVIALITLMLRTGQVTERGTMEKVRRGMVGRES